MEMASNESADRLIDIVNRLDALDRKLDDRFAAVDRRFEQVDQRFDKEHSFFMTLSEDSRSDVNNLYDFVRRRLKRQTHASSGSKRSMPSGLRISTRQSQP